MKVVRSIQNKYNMASVSYGSTSELFRKAPTFNLMDIKTMMKTTKCNRDLYIFLETFDMNRITREFEVPMLYIIGTNDYVNNYEISLEDFDQIEAPYKKLYKIEGACNDPMMEEPGTFTDILVDISWNLSRN